MSNNNREQNPNNQHQGQDKGRDNTQPGQAGGDQMPRSDRNAPEGQSSDRDSENKTNERK